MDMACSYYTVSYATNLPLFLKCHSARGKVELRRFDVLGKPTQTVHHYNTLAALQVISRHKQLFKVIILIIVIILLHIVVY